MSVCCVLLFFTLPLIHLQGFADLKLGRDVVCKPMDIAQAMASKGEMGRVVRQHQSRTSIRKGGARALYRCVRKAIVRAEPSMDSASVGDLFEGDIVEELYEVFVDGTRRLNFETVWAKRGPDLGLVGWMSVVNRSGEVTLEALSSEKAALWRQGTKPTLLRRSVAMYKSLAEQSLVYQDGLGGGVYTCVKPGVIRAHKRRFVSAAQNSGTELLSCLPEIWKFLKTQMECDTGSRRRLGSCPWVPLCPFLRLGSLNRAWSE